MTPNPARIFRTLTAFHETAALKAGIELELFTAIAEGHETPADLARRIGASEKGTRILCDSLVVLEFLTKQDGRYGLAPDTAVFLNKRSPAYVGAASEFLVDESQRTGAYELLTDAVRKGGAAFSEEGTVSRENPTWLTFARTMAPLMAPAAQLLAARVGSESGPLSVLDIAAGHGLFGIAFATRNPQATVTGVDWKFVLEAALENASAAGVADRYRTIPGSAFEVDLGGPYDVALLPNFLHHFDEDDVRRDAEAAARRDEARRDAGGARVRAQRGSRVAAMGRHVRAHHAGVHRPRRRVHLRRSRQDVREGGLHERGARSRWIRCRSGWWLARR